jgi:hypothetical protein
MEVVYSPHSPVYILKFVMYLNTGKEDSQSHFVAILSLGWEGTIPTKHK